MDRGYHRDHSRRFLVPRHGIVAGPGGLSADVDDVGTLFDHAPGLDHGGLRLVSSPAGDRSEEPVA